MAKTVLVILFFCAVCVNSDDDSNGRFNRMPEYLKIKRAKYYSNPPMRIFRRPPITYPVKGSFSYTPPPNYMEHDSQPPSGFRPKVSKRHPIDGLEDKDISNIVNNLSKKDLDKIIEFAGEKYRVPPFGKYNTPTKNLVSDPSDVSIYKSKEIAVDQTFPPNPAYTSNNIGQANYEMQYTETNLPPANNFFKPKETATLPFRGPITNPFDANNYGQNVPSQQYQNSQPFGRPQDLTDIPLHTGESLRNSQFSFVDSYIQEDLYGAASEKETVTTFTDSKMLKEEVLPKPANLRENKDNVVASSNNVPSVTNSNSYKVENFGNLPLMDYNSKRDSVSSYHVPHYTVFSSSNSSPPPSAPTYASAPSSPPSPPQLMSPTSAAIQIPELEPAPPVSAAKDQSDAHLKAIKIWTHHSRGTAYTLHDDGTLSLESPEKTKPSYES